MSEEVAAIVAAALRGEDIEESLCDLSTYDLEALQGAAAIIEYQVEAVLNSRAAYEKLRQKWGALTG